MVTRATDYAAVIQAPFGRIGIKVASAGLCGIDLVDRRERVYATESAFVQEVCHQLHAYFEDPQYVFALPIAPSGTPFQNRVWRVLQRIPPGIVVSYADLAHRLGTGARAVGSACRSNPVPIVVPCHRVVARSGLGGYMGSQSGDALRMKQWLLSHEQSG